MSVTRLLPVLAGAAVLAASGVVHGLRTDRWGKPADVEALAARLAAVPAAAGDWEGRPVRVNDRQLEAAQVVAHLARDYVHRRTGQAVTVLLLGGRPKDIAVHTPDVCYEAAGHAMEGDVERFRPAGGVDAELFTARFGRGGAAPDPLRIYWSWTDGGPWQAPDNPRLTFAGKGVLYKLYAVQPMTRPDRPAAEEPAADLLRALLPQLRQCLGAGS
jgi:hypothetical protein